MKKQLLAAAALAVSLSSFAQDIKLPPTLTVTAYDTGSSGFNIAVAVGKAFKDKHGTDLRVLPAGSVLQLGGMSRGCRSYLAARGGFDVPPLLGSRSSDLHARIGRALQAGDVLPIGAAAPLRALPARHDVCVLGWGPDPQPWFDFARRPLALLHGSHWAAMDSASQRQLYGGHFTLSKDSNRTASRLDGHALHLAEPLELVSEAVLPGTLQLPPSGQPIVLQAEAPVTGGYPRIGQLAAVDLPRLAQLRPGDTVCFRETGMDEALARLAAHRQRLTRMLDAIAQRLETGT